MYTAVPCVLVHAAAALPHEVYGRGAIRASCNSPAHPLTAVMPDPHGFVARRSNLERWLIDALYSSA